MKENYLNQEQKLEIRKRIFLHLDGWAVIPVMSVLHQNSILKTLLKKSKISFEQLSKLHKSNEGYLNVAIRILASQGYLARDVDNKNDRIDLTLTKAGREALELAHHYLEINQLITDFTIRPKNVLLSENTSKINKAIRYIELFKSEETSVLAQRMAIHMEGILLGSIIINLGINNKLDKLFHKLSPTDLDLDQNYFQILSKLLVMAQFAKSDEKTIRLNNKGLYYLKRASSYGVTVSYLPTLANLQSLLFGNPNFLWKKDTMGHESHVYRYMNVWGSGGAHKSYFKKIDEIVIELFNQPLEKQPLGIIDVGCGDGSLLIHLYRLIETHTVRGKNLEKYPLHIIGADYNKKARTATKNNLNKAGIHAEVIFGDISNPQEINQSINSQFNLELNQLLNIRTFLDHNRIYSKPSKVHAHCNSDGAFSFKGERIPNNELFQNLINHFKQWAPYLQNFGLLLVELHSINTETASKYIGDTLASPYDATHGFSDQYIIELPCFLKAIQEAGLYSLDKHLKQIPDVTKPTISIQLVRSLPANL